MVNHSAKGVHSLLTREDPIRRALEQKSWVYGQQDDAARQELKARIIKTARLRGLITYSALVNGILFRLGNANGGRPFTIEDWTEHERAIVGDFLGMINAESYSDGGIFLSAIVVQKSDGTPGPGYTRFMLEIGALRSRSEEAASWAHEVSKVHAHYTRA